MSIFGEIGQSYVEILTFFNFSKWRPMLDFQICEISLADSVWKAQTHNKCRQNWSSVVEILKFFEFSKWPLPPSWIFKIA